MTEFFFRRHRFLENIKILIHPSFIFVRILNWNTTQTLIYALWYDHYPVGVLLKLACERQLPLKSHLDGSSKNPIKQVKSFLVSPVSHSHWVETKHKELSSFQCGLTDHSKNSHNLSVSIEISLNGKTVKTNNLAVSEALIAKSDTTDCLKTKDSTGWTENLNEEHPMKMKS